MSAPNHSDDATADSPMSDSADPPTDDPTTDDPATDDPATDNPATDDQSIADDTPSNDSPTDGPTTDSGDSSTADQPFCRVFSGPTSHRVQYTGPESQPATAIDCEHNARSQATDSQSDGRRTAGGRAIATLLAHRFAALERTLDAVRAACWRGETPDAVAVREVRTQLVDLQVAVEEHLARACPETKSWECASEYISRARLVERLDRDGVCVDDGQVDHKEQG